MREGLHSTEKGEFFKHVHITTPEIMARWHDVVANQELCYLSEGVYRALNVLYCYYSNEHEPTHSGFSHIPEAEDILLERV